MTLQVSFDDFASTAERFKIKEAYLHVEGERIVVTGANAEMGVSLLCQTYEDYEDAKRDLSKAGLSVFKGIWSEKWVTISQRVGPIFVAAVSYQSGHPLPGVWVDVFDEEPNHIQVLEALYKEFQRTGEMPEITIEEFIRNACPNVVVLSHSQLRGFIAAKKVDSTTAE